MLFRSIQPFAPFLGALFIIALGLACLETAANPYASVLGPPDRAAQRLNLSQSFNGLGWVVGPMIGSLSIFAAPAGTDRFAALAVPYVGIGLVVLAVFSYAFLAGLMRYFKSEHDAAQTVPAAAPRVPPLPRLQSTPEPDLCPVIHYRHPRGLGHPKHSEHHLVLVVLQQAIELGLRHRVLEPLLAVVHQTVEIAHILPVILLLAAQCRIEGGGPGLRKVLRLLRRQLIGQLLFGRPTLDVEICQPPAEDARVGQAATGHFLTDSRLLLQHACASATASRTCATS